MLNVFTYNAKYYDFPSKDLLYFSYEPDTEAGMEVEMKAATFPFRCYNLIGAIGQTTTYG